MDSYRVLQLLQKTPNHIHSIYNYSYKHSFFVSSYEHSHPRRAGYRGGVTVSGIFRIWATVSQNSKIQQGNIYGVEVRQGQMPEVNAGTVVMGFTTYHRPHSSKLARKETVVGIREHELGGSSGH